MVVGTVIRQLRRVMGVGLVRAGSVRCLSERGREKMRMRRHRRGMETEYAGKQKSNETAQARHGQSL